LLVNAEYQVTLVSSVRLIAFYDAAQVVGESQSFALDHFRTSTGLEVRFFMPVLNVPFRLIFAMNPQREGILNNRLQPAKRFVFRFAVGSSF
jgi:outer membrane protein assembly factor BamA